MHVGAIVQVSGSMFFGSRKEDFLLNKENKQQFINLLSDHLKSHGCHTEHARTDADLLIVQTAIVADNRTTKSTVLVADDTDILILLCLYTHPTTTNIYLKIMELAVLINILGLQVCNNVLFAHAILGCDITSHIYGQRKGDALKLMYTNQVFQEQANVFCDPDSTTTDVTVAGEKAIVTIYKSLLCDTLDFLKLQRFLNKVGSSTSHVKLEALNLSSAAAKFHSIRVYLQVQQCMGHRDHMKPEDWGWYEKGGKYLLVLTEKETTPTNSWK